MPTKTNKKYSRYVMMGAIAVLLVALFVWAFWPRAVPVDLGVVSRGTLTDTIDEEARTRVRDTYVVSAPIAGRLLRVEVEPGDEVIGGDSVIARMLAAAPSALDVRTREQARASVSAAEAALRVARADLNSAIASEDLAKTELSRARTLVEKGIGPQASLDTAVKAHKAARAAVDTAKAAISMREAELANARARLIEFNTPSKLDATDKDGTSGGTIPLTAPISGRILRVVQESETTMGAGQPILEIGDVSNDLEVLTELLSTDAVQVKPGNQVLIDNWGGDAPLQGVVDRVEPWGFTKYSALGVEEQRVNTIIRFTDPLDQRSALGHGYRVEVKIVTWEQENTLLIPSSALFRQGDDWAVFRVSDSKVELKRVELIRNNGLIAGITSGVSEGDELVLYPSTALKDGTRVAKRGADNA